MDKSIVNVVAGWLSIVFPPASALVDTVDYVRSFSDRLLFQKLEHVLKNQDSDFDEWLKLSENFEEDSRNYDKMVQQLIYYINAINEIDMLSAYANLLSAYKLGFISKKDFFRMSFCLTKLLSEDAQYLKDNITRETIEENIYCLSLSSNNLMYNMTRGFEEDKEYYAFTQMGKMIDKYALSFAEEGKYQYTRNDTPLSEQKLSYSYIPNGDNIRY